MHTCVICVCVCMFVTKKYVRLVECVWKYELRSILMLCQAAFISTVSALLFVMLLKLHFNSNDLSVSSMLLYSLAVFTFCPCTVYKYQSFRKKKQITEIKLHMYG